MLNYVKARARDKPSGDSVADVDGDAPSQESLSGSAKGVACCFVDLCAVFGPR